LASYIFADGIFTAKFAYGIDENPSDQNSPPHSCSFTSGCLANIFLAVILFIILMISVTLSLALTVLEKGYDLGLFLSLLIKIS